jgi:zinc transporter ZupT
MMLSLDQVALHFINATNHKQLTFVPKACPAELENTVSSFDKNECTDLSPHGCSVPTCHELEKDIPFDIDAMTASAQLKRWKWKMYLIEASIALHSILIGLGLGVLEETESIHVLTAALAFHQLFEGIVIGGMMVQIKFDRCVLLVMGVSFVSACPLGVGIGILVHEQLAEPSVNSQWILGSLNAIAAGSLIYIGLVDFMAEDFKLPANGVMRCQMMTSSLCAAFIMCVLAEWA